jgi:hypothetical protein
MKRISILLSGLFFLSTLAATQAQVFYGATSSGSTSELYTIDPSTGAATAVGALVDSSENSYAITGLAFDSVTGTLYGSTSNSSPTLLQGLVKIDPATGLVTQIGTFNTGVASNTMADITFDSSSGTLYGAGSHNGNLYSINVASGLATLVGPSGYASVRGNGMAADAAGTIWGAPIGGDGGELVNYSKANGAVTNVAALSGGPFPPGAFGPNPIAALTFDSTGTLYGVAVDFTSAGTNRPTHLVTINLANGAITDVGASVDFLDALVYVPEPASAVLFGTGLALLAIVGIRRRR